MIRQFLFIILCLGISNAQEKQKTFSGDDIWGETNYRTTLHKAFPNLETCAYHCNGEILIGVFRDTQTKKLLVVFSNGIGNITVRHNGKVVNHFKLKRATISIQANKNTNSRYDEDLGFWLPYKNTDTFSLNGNFDWPVKSTFQIDYDPDHGWASTLSKPVFPDGKIKKADAYHFTEGSLIDDVRSVLKKRRHVVSA